MFGFGFGSGESHKEDLIWLLGSPAWTVDFLPLREPWRGGKPARAMLVVMAEGNVVHEEILDASAVAEPGDDARLRRQRDWERTPHPVHGRSPLRIAAEAEDGLDFA